MNLIFGQDAPLAVQWAESVATVLIFGGICWLVFRLVFSKKVEGFRPRKFRRAIVWVVEMIAVLWVILSTALGALTGMQVTKLLLLGQSYDQSILILGTIVGGFAGFLISSLAVAMLLTLSEIERNTRHTAMMLDALASGRQ